MQDNLWPKGFDDPYDRLNQLELALEEACDQLRSHAHQFVQISEMFMQMAKAFETLKLENRNLHDQTQNLHHRLRVLENKETKNEK